MSFNVYVARPIPQAGMDLLKPHCAPLNVGSGTLPLSHDELLAGVVGRDGVLCAVGLTVDEAVLAAAGPQCRVFANFGVGVDHIDLDAARRLGIIVTNTPDVLTEATADLAWALMLAAARRIVEGDRVARSGEWKGWDPRELHGYDVFGRTLGIIGAGRIGTAVGRRTRGFEMKLIYNSRNSCPGLDEIGAQRVELDTCLRQSDFVSIHTPLNESTHHLIGAVELEQMKSTAILINTARGPVIDESALIDALADRRIAAAGLDVFEHEPRIPESLAALDNVVCLPHLGSATGTARRRMAELAAENLLDVLRGRDARCRVC